MFAHNDLDGLEAILQWAAGKHPKARTLIVTESVFSMDGDLAPLSELEHLAAEYDAALLVDEAHAIGVFGRGGGLLRQLGLPPAGLTAGTLGKSLGSLGGFLVCSSDVREYLVNRARSFIYSTALPPPALAAIDAALDLVPGLGAERRALLANAGEVRAAFRRAGLDCGGSTTQIVPGIVGEDAAALERASRLEEEGILAVAIRPPTVPEGTSRVRFSLSAAHRSDDIALLMRTVPRLASRVRPPLQEAAT